MTRDAYGALPFNTDETRPALAMIHTAIATNKLDAEFIETTHKRKGFWRALNYSLFDVRGSTFLIQQRQSERDKYGTHVTFAYYIVQKCGKGVTVTEVAETPAKRATLRKMAKTEPKLGYILDWVQGKGQARLVKREKIAA